MIKITLTSLIKSGGLSAFGIAVYGYGPIILIKPIPIWIAVINTILLAVTKVFAKTTLVLKDIRLKELKSTPVMDS